VKALRVGLAQLALGPLDVERNIARTVAAIEKAAADDAQVVILPELASSGYVLDPTTLAAAAEDVERPGAALRAWSEVAARTRTAVVAGFPQRLDRRLYNSVAVFGPDGQICVVYQKLHLFAGERDVFTPGERGLPIANIGSLRLGVLVCYDLRFPEAVRIHAVRGVDLVAVPTAWVGGFDASGAAEDPTADIGQVHTARVMANVNATPIACASQVGQAGPFAFLGSSVLIDGFGTDIAPPASRIHETVTVLELDGARLLRARYRGPGISPLAQRRTDVYGELLGYVEPATAPTDVR
jgi:N-carbamoylputrescine amidase